MILAAYLALAITRSGIVIRGGTVYDGTGRPPFAADVRIEGDKIVGVGTIRPQKGDRIIDATGLAVAPGFIDAHSHADGGILEDPNAETQIRQGITTAVVGEDGGSALPVSKFFTQLEQHPASINFASFTGQGTIRQAVLGNDQRKPTAAELKRMKELVDQDMRAGALGLSTGLEYEPNRYADTAEIVELTKVAARHHGIYISHVRNEDNQAFEAFRELIEVARQAHIPAEINHIKLCSTRVWGREPEVGRMMEAARKEGLDITADVYPYTYWQSTIRVIIPTEEFGNRALWEQGLKDVGGPSHVLLTGYSPDPTWAGKTIAELADKTGKDPITLIQEIIERCYGKGNKGEESVVVTAMSEEDITNFIRDPHIMFCSDGGLHGTHPRGAGSFPRILGVYARERKVISMTEAIRKMTSLPAKRFGFRDRGVIASGKTADITLFDPKTVVDTATTKEPEAKPIGIPTVIVRGVVVLENGDPTGAHPGRAWRK
ncbi:N-acyl-D-amino-acid deacylase family protein [Fimbriimonas ginsengisoli]|uniref:Putative D-aminoacylase n=1 Tax=Fimbriimonas ginsengisoli Gsoil 348 TaxID=661478 RepID=A0A068NUR4_FIMGI|nr:D-aminoacylase [Fimbriimonas ginsengisoli]AIE85354.1 putative D-aminoacylase [Fimbriimonas ginsengisoli Gsoil 348]